MDSAHYQLHLKDTYPVGDARSKVDPLSQTWHGGSTNRMDFRPHTGDGIWKNRATTPWHGKRNMFSEKPRQPHQLWPPGYFDPKMPYAQASKEWRSEYQEHVGKWKPTPKRKSSTRGKQPGGNQTLPDYWKSSQWTSDYREGSGSKKTPKMMATAKREISERLKPKLPPPHERIHPHWDERKGNKYASGYNGWIASDYQDGSGFFDESAYRRSGTKAYKEYHYIRGRDLYCGSGASVGY